MYPLINTKTGILLFEYFRIQHSLGSTKEDLSKLISETQFRRIDDLDNVNSVGRYEVIRKNISETQSISSVVNCMFVWSRTQQEGQWKHVYDAYEHHIIPHRVVAYIDSDLDRLVAEEIERRLYV